MKKYLLKISLLFFLMGSLTGCFELIEDTTLNEDGSGKYMLTLNFSASQTRLNSIMALDSIKGKKIPSEADLRKEVNDFVERINLQNGVSKATASFSTEDWILKFSCDFESLESLQKGWGEAAKKWQKKDSPGLSSFFQVDFENGAYTRLLKENISEELKKKAAKDEDYQKLKDGKCVFIQRFPKPIISTSTDAVKVAKNNTACMLMLTPYEILNEPARLSYSIQIKQ